MLEKRREVKPYYSIILKIFLINTFIKCWITWITRVRNVLSCQKDRTGIIYRQLDLF